MAPQPERLPRTRNGTPKLRRTDDVLDYWVERISEVAPPRENFSLGSMICESDMLFHYGHHFELARIIRNKRGRTRLVLLNGDSYGGNSGLAPSTSSRQGDVRHAVSRTDVPSMIVPFSALAAAEIDFDTIAPIHVRGDRHTIEEHSSRGRPAGSKLATMPDPSGATETETYWDYSTSPPRQREREAPVRVKNPNETRSFSTEHGWCETGARRGEDGIWRWQVRRHWLGDSIFRARTTERRTRKATAEELAHHERLEAWTVELRRLQAASRALSDDPLRSETHRAYLRRIRSRRKIEKERPNYGRMFRRAFAAEGYYQQLKEHSLQEPEPNPVRNGRVPITVTRWATFLSSFDYQEARPLYFLCELPYGAKPNTVDEAIESLKPPEVVAAEARGLKVTRQGDLFAIPTKLTKRQIRRMRGREDFTKRLRVLGTNHSVSEGIVCKGGAVLGRGIMRHEPEGWRGPDHARQKLADGKTWHLLVRNTVPRSR